MILKIKISPFFRDSLGTACRSGDFLPTRPLRGGPRFEDSFCGGRQNWRQSGGGGGGGKGDERMGRMAVRTLQNLLSQLVS